MGKWAIKVKKHHLRAPNGLVFNDQSVRNLFSQPDEGDLTNWQSIKVGVEASVVNEIKETYLGWGINFFTNNFLFLKNVKIYGWHHMAHIRLEGFQPSFKDTTILIARDFIAFETLPQ